MVVPVWACGGEIPNFEDCSAETLVGSDICRRWGSRYIDRDDEYLNGHCFVLIWRIWAFRFMWLSCSHSKVNREGLPAFNGSSWWIGDTALSRKFMFGYCVCTSCSQLVWVMEQRPYCYTLFQPISLHPCNVFTLMVWCLYHIVGEFRGQYNWQMPYF